MPPKLDQLLGARRVLIATDFDGTLAPIVPDPAAARATPRALSALRVLADQPGTVLAVVTGRPLAELERVGEGLPPCLRAGEHGREGRDADGTPLFSLRSGSEGVLDEPWRSAQALVARFPGLGTERKSAGVALHVRGLPSDHPARAAAEAWTRAAEAGGLETLRGREVFEAQLPGGGKWPALQRLARHARADFVVYAGDDATDLLPVERLSASPDGLGVWIRSPERPPPDFVPDLALDGPDGWAAFLESLASDLAARKEACP